MPDVLITENIVGEALDRLRSDLDVVVEPNLWEKRDRLVEEIRSTRALIVRNQTLVTGELISAGWVRW